MAGDMTRRAVELAFEQAKADLLSRNTYDAECSVLAEMNQLLQDAGHKLYFCYEMNVERTDMKIVLQTLK